ncbi:hypothetical protein ACKU05_026265 [Klebsiella pneumoniae]
MVDIKALAGSSIGNFNVIETCNQFEILAAGKTTYFFCLFDKLNLTDGLISPLKALINDQYRRLGSLGDALEMPVTPWHGDVPQSKKKKARTDPAGIFY